MQLAIVFINLKGNWELKHGSLDTADNPYNCQTLESNNKGFLRNLMYVTTKMVYVPRIPPKRMYYTLCLYASNVIRCSEHIA